MTKYYGISPKLLNIAEKADKKIAPLLDSVSSLAAYNQLKVLQAFHAEGLRAEDLFGTTGYGYHDRGREKTDNIFARIFGGETALVRWQFVSGTHAISTAILSNCKPKDIIAVLGRPYDTLRLLLEDSEKCASALAELGVKVYHLIPDNWPVNPKWVAQKIPKNTNLLFLQRSRGYSQQPSLSIKKIKEIIKECKRRLPSLLIMVDNCYGEFVEEKEPGDVGADFIAGSLIKNPGGSLVPTGGYIAGRKECVKKASERLLAPGLGENLGATLGFTRSILHGLFLAPQIVGEAVKGSMFSAAFWEDMGYKVFPKWKERRTDIIQGVILGSREKAIAFSKGIQMAGPVDSVVQPEGWKMPGYKDEIIMAGGTFIQGGSLELSCDAPFRQPYIVYLQGGISAAHSRLGCILAAKELEAIKAPV